MLSVKLHKVKTVDNCSTNEKVNGETVLVTKRGKHETAQVCWCSLNTFSIACLCQGTHSVPIRTFTSLTIGSSVDL